MLRSATDTRTRGAHLLDALALVDELRPLASALGQEPRSRGESEDVDLQREGKPRRFRLVRISLPDPAGGASGSVTIWSLAERRALRTLERGRAFVTDLTFLPPGGLLAAYGDALTPFESQNVYM